MAFSHGYGQIPDEQQSIEAIQNAFAHGCTFFDTAEVYSPGLSGIGYNERILHLLSPRGAALYSSFQAAVDNHPYLIYTMAITEKG